MKLIYLISEFILCLNFLKFSGPLCIFRELQIKEQSLRNPLWMKKGVVQFKNSGDGNYLDVFKIKWSGFMSLNSFENQSFSISTWIRNTFRWFNFCGQSSQLFYIWWWNYAIFTRFFLWNRWEGGFFCNRSEKKII